MVRNMLLFALLVLLMLLPTQATSQSDTDTDMNIWLQVATFDPLTDGEPSLALTTLAAAEESPYYIVQFIGPIETTWVEQVEALGAEILGYVPDNAHIARIAEEDVEKIRTMYAVRWVGPYQAGYKMDSSLTRNVQLAASAKDVEIYVAAFPGESLADLRAFLTRLGATINDGSESEVGLVIQAALPESALIEVVANPAVSWIEPYLMPVLTNDQERQILNAEAVWNNSGFFGAGQIVAVSDSGLSVEGNLNADFAGRLVQAFPPSEMNLSSPECGAKTDWTDLNGHGTHVAGSVLGNGTNSGSNAAAQNYAASLAGVAPEAQLVFMAMNTDGSTGIQCISTNGSFIVKGYEEGARISSNSWGGFDPSDPSPYTLLSSVVDNYVWNQRDYMVLFAAGNAGDFDRDGSTNFSTIGAPGTAKNILTVGASGNIRPEFGENNPDGMASFSSRGPTSDGRVKPDVTAPGVEVVSVRGEDPNISQQSYPSVPGTNDQYAHTSGTSMATPLTAGSTALVREWLGKERNIANPTAALLKALMIHGAQQLPGFESPNVESGWGRVDLNNTLNGQYAIFEDDVQGLTNGQERTYTIQVANTPLGALVSEPVEVNGGTLASASTLTIEQVPLQNEPVSESSVTPDDISFEPVVGYDTAAINDNPLPDSNNKIELSPLVGPPPTLRGEGILDGDLGSAGEPTLNSFLLNIVGGGDFEEPGWTEFWNSYWLGFGVPVRVDQSSGRVLAGNYSVWLGGSPSDDSIWYPFHLPDTIDTQFPSSVTFDFALENLDPGFDQFCIAFTDVSGFVIGELQQCYGTGQDGADQELFPYSYTAEFTPAQLDLLAGQTGYLVLLTVGDGLLPHMSSFVDNVSLNIDYPDVTLTSVPGSGPPGTRFLLQGTNNTPYSEIAVCLGSCSPETLLGTVYADAQGDVAAYVTPEESVTLTSQDFFGREASVDIVVTEDGGASLTAEPTEGPAGTTFVLTGSGFLPNDTNITLTADGEVATTVGSDEQGNFRIELGTAADAVPRTLTIGATGSGDRSAQTTVTITERGSGEPNVTVNPTTGVPGTRFVFSGTNFEPASSVAIQVNGQQVRELDTDATGAFSVGLRTEQDIPLGTYSLTAIQGETDVTVEFEVTAGDPGTGDPPAATGNGLYVTLVWTDPPAQVGTARALVNNLDLTVTGPDGQTLLGNGGNEPDNLNNVETIRLEQPASGEYTVTVSGTQITGEFGAQPFALVATTAQEYGVNTSDVDAGGPGGATDQQLYLPFVRQAAP